MGLDLGDLRIVLLDDARLDLALLTDLLGHAAAEHRVLHGAVDPRFIDGRDERHVDEPRVPGLRL